MDGFLSIGDVARLLRQPARRVRRIYEDGDLAEPGRFAGRRVILACGPPAIIDAMRHRGWPRAPETAEVAGS